MCPTKIIDAATNRIPFKFGNQIVEDTTVVPVIIDYAGQALPAASVLIYYERTKARLAKELFSKDASLFA